ncbi:hypothetical protein [Flavivirga rizhaonensis]|uniref:Uncharacterized protein n=1 Tax=Flavivirga rizhaonensis TaxID=2559571 RepID=A0A4S1DZG4_9FLAO|nr:hypothetical protein [Flavivirga rizhaonensis]TGV03637.1 hypothetical protein EM932_06320 [Flavivirga rizhaonensis]
MAIQVEVDNRSFLIPEATDPCDFWTSYFKELKREVDQDNAKMLWLLTWKSTGSATCTTSPNFNKWMLKNNLDVSNMATRSIADISEIGGNLFGLGKNLTKVLFIGIPIVLVVVLIVFLVMLRNTTKNADITDLTQLTPIGRLGHTAKLLSK